MGAVGQGEQYNPRYGQVPRQAKTCKDAATSSINPQFTPLTRYPAELPELQWYRSWFDSVYSAELTLSAVYLTVKSNRVDPAAATVDDPNQTHTVRTFAYNGMIPGPLIRMKACNTYKLTVVNKLGDWPKGTSEPTSGNGIFRPTVTNLHVHGLHISSTTPGDDVVNTKIAPGSRWTYTYKIPCDHVSGTYWYHPHRHGSTALQADSGAAGMLIIEGSGREAYDTAAPYRDLPENMLVIQELNFEKLAELASLSGDKLFHYDGALFPHAAPPPAVLANGCVACDAAAGAVCLSAPLIEVEAGQWARVRVLNVATMLNVVLRLEPADGGGAAACDVAVLAKDGVPLAQLPRMLDATRNAVFLSLASRVDLAIRCPYGAGGDGVAPAGAQLIKYKQLDALGATVKASPVESVLGTIAVYPSKRPKAKDLVATPWTPCRPAYLADIPETAPNLKIKEAFVVPLVAMALDKYAMTLNVPEKWAVQFSAAHPMHTHVNHMLLGAVDSTQQPDPLLLPDWHQKGDWVDTLAMGGAAATVYVRPERFAGNMVVHCHVAEHADKGMSAVATVAGLDNPPDAFTVVDYGTCTTPPAETTPFFNQVYQIDGSKKHAMFFDNGKDGVAYHNIIYGRRKELFLETTLGQNLRRDSSTVEVDFDRQNNEFFVTEIRAGEFLRYTINVPTTGAYQFATYIAKPIPPANRLAPGISWKLFLDVPPGGGCPPAGSPGDLFHATSGRWRGSGPPPPAKPVIVKFPATGSWDIDLEAGLHTLTLCFDTYDRTFDLYYIELKPAEL